MSEVRFRYNGKELQIAGALNFLDYGARMYDSKLGRWFVQDPKSEKYYSTSPYVYCLNNPIRFIDPDGEDVWEIDKDGAVINQIKDKTQDAFHLVEQTDGEWQRVEGQSVSFDYGTVNYRTSTEKFDYGNGQEATKTLHVFEVKGDNNATQLFEFLAQPGQTTDVEWGHVKVGDAKTEQNMVGTINEYDKSGLEGYALNYGYTIREANHNHPSGYGIASSKDIDMATSIQDKFSKATMNVYTTNPRTYTPYNKNTPKPTQSLINSLLK